MGKRSREKGKKWEQKVACVLRPIFGGLVKRGIQSRDGGEVTDVEGTPFWVECKHAASTSKANPFAALEQGETATDGRPVVVFCKLDNRPPLMAVRMDLGLDLLRAWAKTAPSILRVGSGGPRKGRRSRPAPGRPPGRPAEPRAGPPPCRKTPPAPPARERPAGEPPAPVPASSPADLPPPPPPEAP